MIVVYLLGLMTRASNQVGQAARTRFPRSDSADLYRSRRRRRDCDDRHRVGFTGKTGGETQSRGRDALGIFMEKVLTKIPLQKVSTNGFHAVENPIRD